MASMYPQVVASMYPQVASRPGYSRETSGSSVSRRVSRASTRNSNTMPAPMQQILTPRDPRPDVAKLPIAQHGARPPSAVDQGNLGRRTSSQSTDSDPSTLPRVLTLTNWNPSTDAIAFGAAGRPREKPRGHVVKSVSFTEADMLVASSVTGRPSALENAIMHADGGMVRGDASKTDS